MCVRNCVCYPPTSQNTLNKQRLFCILHLDFFLLLFGKKKLLKYFFFIMIFPSTYEILMIIMLLVFWVLFVVIFEAFRVDMTSREAATITVWHLWAWKNEMYGKPLFSVCRRVYLVLLLFFSAEFLLCKSFVFFSLALALE